MFSLRCFISFLLILAQSEIYEIRESRRRLILGDPKEIVVGVRESRDGRNKKLAKNLCLPRYNEGIGIGGVFKGHLQ